MTIRSTNESWLYFRNLFLARSKRIDPDITKITGLTQKQSQSIGQSLSIFQAGESGEGRLAKQILSHERKFIDDDYRKACILFVQEEGRHGRILAKIIAALGYKKREASVANNLFIFTRRILDISFKLLVLLVAELVGLTYYSYLAALLKEEQLVLALEEICNDEVDHLFFHLNYFHLLIKENRPSRFLYVPASLFIGVASFTFVALEHRQSIACAGGTPILFLLEGYKATFNLTECMLRGQRSTSVLREKISNLTGKNKN